MPKKLNIKYFRFILHDQVLQWLSRYDEKYIEIIWFFSDSQ